MKGSCCMIFLVLLLQFQLAWTGAPLATALFVFGDSLSDSGNNNDLETAARVNYPPYGTDFASGITGRFTNGRTFPDITAEFLGLPYPPAYLSLSEEKRKSIKTGMNYASGGSGLLDETGEQLGECISFKQQLDYFEKTAKVDMKSQFQDDQALSDHLAKSIFIISIGNNDMYANYVSTHENLEITPELEAFIQSMFSALSAGVKRLYEIGARKFVVFGICAVGCTPAIASILKDPTQCSAVVNGLGIAYNQRFQSIKKQLESEHKEAAFVFGDVFPLNVDMHDNPQNYGFKNSRDPCCEATPSLEGTCTPKEEPCKERNEYVYWDLVHPTEAVNAYIANHCFSDNTICTPINIYQLAQNQ